jgi:preprotein translocase subunit YajC
VTLATILIWMQPQQGGDPSSSMISTLVMFAFIIGIFYFMIIRPQQKRQKEREKLLSALKKGDKVVTSGGMYGTVAGLDEKTVLIEVADNIKMKFERGAVTSVRVEGTPEKETK